jgi:hypothetical protein
MVSGWKNIPPLSPQPTKVPSHESDKEVAKTSFTNEVMTSQSEQSQRELSPSQRPAVSIIYHPRIQGLARGAMNRGPHTKCFFFQSSFLYLRATFDEPMCPTLDFGTLKARSHQSGLVALVAVDTVTRGCRLCLQLSK